jgi:hypothetical protein
MSDEAAVNAMAAQVVYGDDELRRDMRIFICDTIREVLNQDADPQLKAALIHRLQYDVGKQVIVNQAREIEKIVARYLTNKLSGDQY